MWTTSSFLKSAPANILLFFMLTGVQSVRIVKQNYHEVTVNVGQEVELVCTVESVVKACNFRTQSGEVYALFSNAHYEQKRIVPHMDSEFDCGIKIDGVKESDHGQWECSVTALGPSGEFSVGKGFINVTVAVPPSDVYLRVDGEQVHSSVLSVKVDESPHRDITCVATQARPKPTFQWFIGNTEISADFVDSVEEASENDIANYAQTLKYHADSRHNKQQLKCLVNHMGYTNLQMEDKINSAEFTLDLLFKPEKNDKPIQEFYELREGESNEIRLVFRANPKPNDGIWNINEHKVAIGSESVDRKYQSTMIEDGDVPGEYFVILTIHNLSPDDIGKTNTLMLTNAEGSTEYKFKLEIGSKPPADVGDFSLNFGMPISSEGESASAATIGIVILVLIIIAVAVITIVARVKGLLCFAAKSGEQLDAEKQALEEEDKQSKSIMAAPSGDHKPKSKSPDKKSQQQQQPPPHVPTAPENNATITITTSVDSNEDKKSNGAHTPV